jgi:PPK2 family polyphosphate:nucleotide phosphotransferase
MLPKKEIVNFKKFKVKSATKVRLKDHPTGYEGTTHDKKEAEALLQESLKQLSVIQDKLYAYNKLGVLIIFQAMDAAGKDGAVKHVMSGLNPQGVKVCSFKAPNALELDHHFLWRHQIALPARGEIAIHNRSHYENVLITRVHPELILNEKLPAIDSVDKIDESFWQMRLRQINSFEKTLVENGTVILKFFLHLSKNEQKKRFLERIENPAKNWKFSAGDIKEREYWKCYQQAYEKAIQATSTDDAPWFIIPADDKWYARLAIASIIHQQFNKLEIDYPVLDKDQKKEHSIAKAQLQKQF